MNVGDIVLCIAAGIGDARASPGISGHGIVIENESTKLYETKAEGITGVDVELAKLRHQRYGDQWKILLDTGALASCWGQDLEVVNEVGS